MKQLAALSSRITIIPGSKKAETDWLDITIDELTAASSALSIGTGKAQGGDITAEGGTFRILALGRSERCGAKELRQHFPETVI